MNGFELLMASYAMAHLKLDMLLTETGYIAKQEKRLRVYLTNSLEESHPDTGTLFAQWLANEANEANRIKRDTPVMVVMGNPPYSGESANKGAWILELMEDYKREPDTTMRLQERNAKWLNDDYCKFIRLGQEFVDRNTEGVLAYINNHSFLDNPTFRGMRWNLMQSFDKIYIVDLHGNSKKKEVCPDGSKDENVFDIQQGVSINIFVKTGQKPAGQLAEVFHYDLYGRRAEKYSYLAEHDLGSISFTKLSPTSPEYFFVPQNNEWLSEYKEGFSVSELFSINGVGITSAHDEFVIGEKQTLVERFERFKNAEPSVELLHKEFNVKKKTGWSIIDGWKNLQNETDISKLIVSISYRPFDDRHIMYEDKLVWRTVRKIFNHFLNGENVGICLCKQFKTGAEYQHVFISDTIIESSYVSNKTSEITSTFPLYTYSTNGQLTTDGVGRMPNLKPEIVQKIAEQIGLEFEPEQTIPSAGTHFAPIDLLDYIYGVLHTPAYRERYKEFLKTDFPRIPYPASADDFRRIAAVGAELRTVHLMEQRPPITTRFNVAGSNTIEKIKTTEPNNEGSVEVWINDTQHFDNVPLVAWEFYIGGYQPAQKWLKDRAGRTLSHDELSHYQRIIAALERTHTLMQQLH